jgi:hypothetical protein
MGELLEKQTILRLRINRKVKTYCNKIKKGIKISSELQERPLSFKVRLTILKLMIKYDIIIKVHKVISLFKTLAIMRLPKTLLFNRKFLDRDKIYKTSKILRKEVSQ